MKWLNKVQKDTRILLIVAFLIILISGLSAFYGNANANNRLEEVRGNSRLNFVTLEEFRAFVTEKEVTDLRYDIENDIFTGTLKEEDKIKYGIPGGGRVALGNILKLVEENQITNEAILETIENAERSYIEKPIDRFEYTLIIVLILSILYLTLIRPIINNANINSATSKKRVYKSQDKDEELKEKVDVVKLSDVKGHDEIKDDFEFLIKFLKNPKKYEKLGAKRVREIFDEANKHEKAIIYIDEIDAIGKKRTGDNDNDERINTLNALLVEMDGFKDSSGIMIIASTNRLDILDEALLRPGRFDKHIAVNPPDYQGRLDILKLYAENKRLDAKVSLDKIASMIRGFSGADLANLLNEAAMLTAFRDRDRTTMEEIDDALFKILTKGDKKKSYERSQDDTELTAWHEAGHAIVSKLIAGQKVNKVTIIPSTSGAGGITFKLAKDGRFKPKIYLKRSKGNF